MPGAVGRQICSASALPALRFALKAPLLDIYTQLPDVGGLRQTVAAGFLFTPQTTFAHRGLGQGDPRPPRRLREWTLETHRASDGSTKSPTGPHHDRTKKTVTTTRWTSHTSVRSGSSTKAAVGVPWSPGTGTSLPTIFDEGALGVRQPGSRDDAGSGPHLLCTPSTRWVGAIPSGDLPTCSHLRGGLQSGRPAGYALLHGLVKPVTMDTKWGETKMLFACKGDLFAHMAGAGQTVDSSFGTQDLQELRDRKSVIMDSGHLLADDDDINMMDRTAGGLATVVKSGQGIVVELTGPGRVWTQSRNPNELITLRTTVLPFTRAYGTPTATHPRHTDAAVTCAGPRPASSHRPRPRPH